MKLALFDLDHTLLTGDSDALWCDFLMMHGLLDRGDFGRRNEEVMRGYKDGSISSDAFCDFYASTLAGRTLAQWRPWCERFLAESVIPNIPASARALVDRHRSLGDHVVLTTATNRVLCEQTAFHLRISDLLATEIEIIDGRCTGRTVGILNMREGKLERLRAWLAGRGLHPSILADAAFYSDSSNDLPLLEAVGHPVAVDPDDRLRSHAQSRGWEILELARESPPDAHSGFHRPSVNPMSNVVLLHIENRVTTICLKPPRWGSGLRWIHRPPSSQNSRGATVAPPPAEYPLTTRMTLPSGNASAIGLAVVTAHHAVSRQVRIPQAPNRAGDPPCRPSAEPRRRVLLRPFLPTETFRLGMLIACGLGAIDTRLVFALAFTFPHCQ